MQFLEYSSKVWHLTSWCSANNLILNTRKTQEIVVDIRKKRRIDLRPVLINGETVERVPGIKFLGVNITEDFSWSTHASAHSHTCSLLLMWLRHLPFKRECWSEWVYINPSFYLRLHSINHSFPALGLHSACQNFLHRAPDFRKLH